MKLGLMKRQEKELFRRLKGIWPSIAWIYRYVCKGHPHIHLMVFNAPLKRLQNELPEFWQQINIDGQTDAHVQRARHIGRCGSYLAWCQGDGIDSALPLDERSNQKRVIRVHGDSQERLVNPQVEHSQGSESYTQQDASPNRSSTQCQDHVNGDAAERGHRYGVRGRVYLPLAPKAEATVEIPLLHLQSLGQRVSEATAYGIPARSTHHGYGFQVGLPDDCRIEGQLGEIIDEALSREDQERDVK